MQRFIRLAVFVVVLCLWAPSTGLAAGFYDVSKAYTFYDEVEFLASKQVITGFSDGSFKPEAGVTRAEAAIMIGRAVGLNGDPKDTHFSDVTANVTGSGYIASAVERGIISGFPDNTYRPYQQVTRAQMAIFLDKAFTLKNANPDNIFTDISENMIAYPSILNAYENGIVNGYSDATYKPDSSVVRGHFSAFLARALEPSFRSNPGFMVESVSGWDQEADVTEIDIDHEWIIRFNYELDEYGFEHLRDHIYIVRESDSQIQLLEPMIIDNLKIVHLPLWTLYDFDETYTLFIKEGLTSKTGKSLAEPVTIKFHTNKPEFTVKQSVEKDGVQFDLMADPSDEKVYVKVKATNTSGQPIPYTSGSGCDPGLKAALVTETAEGPVKTGSKWSTAANCTLAIRELTLQPGESIEIVEVLYPDVQSFDEEIYLQAVLPTGIVENPKKPIEVSVSLQ
ncbi:S-layer homology domain-containing protein [Niallia endozanthoxylica]|uniref:S-layer homology domain-containing protein n=1 Tax=Niallia endozanthoxylica TaxID=2036016 RepID=A0A5J5HS84_9BACI|nr:S-layer homology domain-containing protein [Niallia endozanthoxylica]KAA9022915.1 S-layer homology domain-containing protein [Niallia endozanthoxylica]